MACCFGTSVMDRTGNGKTCPIDRQVVAEHHELIEHVVEGAVAATFETTLQGDRTAVRIHVDELEEGLGAADITGKKAHAARRVMNHRTKTKVAEDSDRAPKENTVPNLRQGTTARRWSNPTTPDPACRGRPFRLLQLACATVCAARIGRLFAPNANPAEIYFRSKFLSEHVLNASARPQFASPVKGDYLAVSPRR